MPSATAVLVLSNLVLALGLVVAAFAYTKTVAKLHAMQKVAKTKGEKELGKADEKAKEILEKAVLQATEIVNLAELFSKKATNDLERALDLSTKAVVEKYESVLAIAGRQATGQLTILGDEIKQVVVADLANFKKDLEEQVVNYASQLKVASEAAKIAADRQIANYKEHAVAEFEEKLDKRIETLAREILGRQLTSVDHTNLIIKALERAKKEGIFG